jgi:hypothetical protein
MSRRDLTPNRVDWIAMLLAPIALIVVGLVCK